MQKPAGVLPCVVIKAALKYHGLQGYNCFKALHNLPKHHHLQQTCTGVSHA